MLPLSSSTFSPFIPRTPSTWHASTKAVISYSVPLNCEKTDQADTPSSTTCQNFVMYILRLLLVKFALFNKAGKPNTWSHCCTGLFQEQSPYLLLLHLGRPRRRASVKQKTQFILTAQRLTVGLGRLGLFLTGIKSISMKFSKADEKNGMVEIVKIQRLREFSLLYSTFNKYNGASIRMLCINCCLLACSKPA